MAVMKSLDDCSSYFVDSIVSVGEAGWNGAGGSVVGRFELRIFRVEIGCDGLLLADFQASLLQYTAGREIDSECKDENGLDRCKVK
jgi:hypothetical protein